MSGKQHKRDKRREREAARAAARRKQRQQTIFTVIVIAIIVGIGGVLVALSLGDGDELAAEAPTDLPTEPTDAPDDRPVACGAEAPPAAGEEKPTFDAPPDEPLSDGVDYIAVVTTSCGELTIDLDDQRAPETVRSFVFLAEQSFFDGLEIFRNATSIGALQTGSGTNDAVWDVGYTIPDELHAAEDDGYPSGTVAMANAGPDTAGSQFFFVYSDRFDQAFDDQRAYARFGQVTDGLDVLDEIGAIPTQAPDDPSNETPSQIVYLESVEIRTSE